MMLLSSRSDPWTKIFYQLDNERSKYIKSGPIFNERFISRKRAKFCALTTDGIVWMENKKHLLMTMENPMLHAKMTQVLFIS